MNASKEEARNAKLHLIALSDWLSTENRRTLSRHIIEIEEFLDAAAKKLPSEVSYNREKSKKESSK